MRISGHRRGSFEDCDIFADRRVGMAIWERPIRWVRRWKIHENKESGVMVFSRGRATLEDCELWGQDRNNVDIRDGCQVHRTGDLER